MTDPTVLQLVGKVAALEERMNTKQAEYRSDIAELAKEIATRNAEAADRMARWGWWQMGVTLAAIGLAVGLILHFLPSAPP